MIPKLLKIKDFLSHTDSKINFDNFNIALIIGLYVDNADESNGAGKTAILSAIRWVLFDKSRHKKKDGVVKRDAPACRVEFQFLIENQLYKIIRKRNKIVGESEVNLYLWNTDKFIKIECDTNTTTDRKIVEIINFNHDTFINSIYFKQNDISIFTESTPSKKKDVFKHLLKLDKWDKYQKRAKTKYNKISKQITEKTAVFTEVGLIEKEIKKCNNGIVLIEEKLKNTNKQFDLQNNHLFNKRSELQFIENKSENNILLNLESSLEEKKKRLSVFKRSITINDKLIYSNKSLIISNQKILEKCERAINNKKSIDIEKKRTALILGKTKFKILKERIGDLSKNLKSDDECDLCFRQITSKKEAASIKNNRKNKLNEMQTKCTALEKKIISSNVVFKKLEKTISLGISAELKKSKLDAQTNILIYDLKKAISENKTLRKRIKKIDISVVESEILSIKDRFNKNNINSLKSDSKKLEVEVASLKNKIDCLNIDYGSKTSYKNELITNKTKQEKLTKELSALSEELIIYDKLRQGFGKDGIQSIIIENVVEELENYTNGTLSQICNEPTSISISMQKQSDTGSWNETFDINVSSGGRKDEFESLSGGEKFRISMALRLAFSKILSKRMGGSVKFLLLDEVSSSLDRKGLDMFVNIIKHIGNDMKILIITHDDRLKDKFDDIIVVEKDSSGSKARI